MAAANVLARLEAPCEKFLNKEFTCNAGHHQNRARQRNLEGRPASIQARKGGEEGRPACVSDTSLNVTGQRVTSSEKCFLKYILYGGYTRTFAPPSNILYPTLFAAAVTCSVAISLVVASAFCDAEFRWTKNRFLDASGCVGHSYIYRNRTRQHE